MLSHHLISLTSSHITSRLLRLHPAFSRLRSPPLTFAHLITPSHPPHPPHPSSPLLSPPLPCSQVISKCCYPPLPRFDTSTAVPAEGQTLSDLKTFVTFWERIDLSHLFGFPLWESEVFTVLSTNFEQLRSIFDYYAKSGTAGGASAGALLTMQQTELQTLAIDVGMTTDKFSMTRVINIFRRADQVGNPPYLPHISRALPAFSPPSGHLLTFPSFHLPTTLLPSHQVDDTKKSSATDHRVQTGEDAKSGDRSLELHEFIECVVMLSFERANPKYGEVGFTNKTFEVGADGDTVRRIAPKMEWIMLPGKLCPLSRHPPSTAFSYLPSPTLTVSSTFLLSPSFSHLPPLTFLLSPSFSHIPSLTFSPRLPRDPPKGLPPQEG